MTTSESEPIPISRLPEGFARSIDHPPAEPVRARPAATVVLLRDRPGGMELLLLERNRTVGFVPSAFVFPGGRVDPSDAEAIEALRKGDGGGDRSGPDLPEPGGLGWQEPDSDAAQDEPSFPDGRSVPPLAYWFAAMREAFEETGLLVATADGRAEPGDPGETHAPGKDLVAASRTSLEAGDIGFAEVLRRLRVTPDPGRMAYIAHWVTPLVEPRRYDTRFFAAAVPESAEVEVDHGEIVHALWSTPNEALAAHRAGELPMIFPTIRTIEDLARFSRTEEVLDHFRERTVPRWMPRLERRGTGVVTVLDE